MKPAPCFWTLPSSAKRTSLRTVMSIINVGELVFYESLMAYRAAADGLVKHTPENTIIIIIVIIMVISKCYFSREHIALSHKNGVNIELGKTNRLKAMRMMKNHTLNKQTMCQ